MPSVPDWAAWRSRAASAGHRLDGWVAPWPSVAWRSGRWRQGPTDAQPSAVGSRQGVDSSQNVLRRSAARVHFLCPRTASRQVLRGDKVRRRVARCESRSRAPANRAISEPCRRMTSRFAVHARRNDRRVFDAICVTGGDRSWSAAGSFDGKHRAVGMPCATRIILDRWNAACSPSTASEPRGSHRYHPCGNCSGTHRIEKVSCPPSPAQFPAQSPVH